MPWLIVILGYFLGSVPTAYLAGRLLERGDIRRMGDGNIGARNAFHHLGAKTGIGIFFIDAGKGALAVLVAQAAGLPLAAVLFTGVAAVIGHNWPVFLGFRGRRGESTTIGVLTMVVTQPMLIMAGLALAALFILRNVRKASAILFVPLPLLGWWLGTIRTAHWLYVALPCLVGFTHFLRTSQPAMRQA